MLLDLSGKGYVAGVPWAVGNDMCLEGNTYKGQVSYHIEQFVTRRFIGETQFQIIQDTCFVYLDILFFEQLRNMLYLLLRYFFIHYDDRIINISAFDQIMVHQVLEFVEETECAAGCYLIIEFG